MPLRKRQSITVKSALILECDTQKLTVDELSLADQFKNNTLLFGGRKVEAVKATTQADLLSQLAQLSSPRRKFHVIVVIGHSNISGLAMAADRMDSWDVVANWLEPFKPVYLVIVACQAGAALPVQALFSGISSLKKVYASPLTITKDQVYILNGLVPYLLQTKCIDHDLIATGQLINLIVTRGWLSQWDRREFTQELRTSKENRRSRRS